MMFQHPHYFIYIGGTNSGSSLIIYFILSFFFYITPEGNFFYVRIISTGTAKPLNHTLLLGDPRGLTRRSEKLWYVCFGPEEASAAVW